MRSHTRVVAAYTNLVTAIGGVQAKAIRRDVVAQAEHHVDRHVSGGGCFAADVGPAADFMQPLPIAHQQIVRVRDDFG
jgi:hypothetical protein